jgi:hypothetical protein
VYFCKKFKKMKNYIVILLLFFSYSCAVQNEFIVSDTSKRNEFEGKAGYVYSIPQTVLKVQTEIISESFIPGPYARFAERYLGISGVSETASSKFSIGHTNIHFLVEPDPEGYMAIHLNKGSFSAAEFISLSSQGLIVVPFGRSGESFQMKENIAASEGPVYTDLSVTGLFSEITDTLYKTIVTDTSFVRLPIPRRQREVKTIEQRAEEAANFILELRRARFDLIAGEIDGFPSGEALGFAVSELNRLESQYLELFTGKNLHNSSTRSVFITPNGKSEEIVLFRLSGQSGFSPASSNEGDPVVLGISPLNKLKHVKAIEMTGDNPVNTLVYRIPDMAIFRISKGNQIYYEERAILYQSGKLAGIPVN